MATLSASTPFPTITLDLTQQPTTAAGGMLHRPQAFPSMPFSMYGAGGFPSSHHRPVMPPPSLGTMGAREMSVQETMTAAIARDPNFTTVLAAALSSIMAAGGAAQPPPRGDGSASGDAKGDINGGSSTDHAAAGARAAATQPCGTSPT
ncbi:hypothetical protein E2562_003369 [Oryza meyeriana var. granulata]|uniref:WRKY domain-containing protein n=1 Tax=Oryza meyeriana var. granulata TaxID=110450 RepID=A0A6G1EDG7_9ORYZ|nr:hypothetical protein E2562_003369 [Oryza meyeriana var. granulata]